jgi:hypothetical protein
VALFDLTPLGGLSLALRRPRGAAGPAGEAATAPTDA